MGDICGKLMSSSILRVKNYQEQIKSLESGLWRDYIKILYKEEKRYLKRLDNSHHIFCLQNFFGADIKKCSGTEEDEALYLEGNRLLTDLEEKLR